MNNDGNLFNDRPAEVRPALDELAKQINAEHAQHSKALHSSLEHARAAGELLLQAKKQVGHGQWMKWLEAKCGLSPRQAQKYVQIAKNWVKCAPGAHLTINEAVAALSGPDEEDEEEAEAPPPVQSCKPFREWAEPTRKQVVADWWDQRASLTVLLTAHGWEPSRIADFLGQPQEAIDAILHPTPPTRFDTQWNGNGFPFDRDPDKQRRFQEIYQQNVQRILAGLFGGMCGVYQRAADTAEKEGFPGSVKTEMQALERHHNRIWKRLSGINALVVWQNDAWFSIPTWGCALTDARLAVGLDPHQKDRHFLSIWGEFLNDVDRWPEDKGERVMFSWQAEAH
jgi:hypothetical protein